MRAKVRIFFLNPMWPLILFEAETCHLEKALWYAFFKFYM